MPSVVSIKDFWRGLRVKCHNHNTKIEFENFLGTLRDSGHRITKQRKLMAEHILRFDLPFSAEELHSQIKRKGVDLVTVYRSLSAFTDLKILTTVDFQDGTLRYEYLPPEEKGHHHHIICTQCRKVEPLNSCMLKKQEKFIEQMGYTNITHKLEFFGLCESCSL